MIQFLPQQIEAGFEFRRVSGGQRAVVPERQVNGDLLQDSGGASAQYDHPV